MEDNLLNSILELFKSKKLEQYYNGEGLLTNKIEEDALKLDSTLLEVLLEDEDTQKAFFATVGDIKVFDKIKFQLYINSKEFLKDSFTKYKQNIGLTDEYGKGLKQNNNVVLNWPYKDCILEGGQDKEDKSRKEVFYNEVLAPEYINILTDKKAFHNAVRVKGEGDKEEPVTDFNRNEDGTITDNLMLKGNNLLVLHSLKSQFAGKIKLIYIDPPYNTGNDGFKYNDRFNHSSWLTFMKNRLEVARELLADDGVIFVQCDDNEQAYLKVLMDEVFGRANFVINLVWENKEGGGKSDSITFRRKHEYIITYAKIIDNIEIYGRDVEDVERYRLSDIHEEYRGKYQLIKLDSASLGYIKSLDYYILSPENTRIFPNKDDNKISRWRWNKKKFEWGVKNDFVVIKKDRDDNWAVYTKQYLNCDNNANIKRRTLQPIGVISKFSNTQSNIHMKSLFGTAKFSYSKPEQLIEFYLQISTKPGDIVLDFFAGSGTTAGVAHKMERQWITIEQMDYIQDITKARLKKVVDGEQGGISKAIDWKGGGEFVYMEMIEKNNRYFNEIIQSESDETLKILYKQIKEETFFRYDIDLKGLDALMDDSISLKHKKEALTQCLDKNHLYLNYSSIDDRNFNKDETVSNLNKKFYKEV
ncbi:MAG: site-specific DNA-methyltransferase [Alphaproteobacteria bacterium]|nr:site-specific DNA-methyltransferase [Alphaproteobacteria bacterium]